MFLLGLLSLSSAFIEAAKADLSAVLPNVPPTHRCEALARGLGFKTYAAALAEIRNPSLCKVQANAEAFLGYLAEKGFSEISQSKFYDAVGREAIREQQARFHDLSSWGLGYGQPHKVNGVWETAREHYIRYQQYRQDMLSDNYVKAFLLSLTLLQRIRPTLTIRPKAGSYRLKHIAENQKAAYPDGEKLGPHYVPSGALIAAALHLGFKVKRYKDHLGYDAPTVSFNMPVKSINSLDAEIRPNSVHGRALQRLEARRAAKDWRPSSTNHIRQSETLV